MPRLRVLLRLRAMLPKITRPLDDFATAGISADDNAAVLTELARLEAGEALGELHTPGAVHLHRLITLPISITTTRQAVEVFSCLGTAVRPGVRQRLDLRRTRFSVGQLHEPWQSMSPWAVAAALMMMAQSRKKPRTVSE